MLVQMIGSIFGIVRMRIIYLTMYQKTGYELSDRAGCLIVNDVNSFCLTLGKRA